MSNVIVLLSHETPRVEALARVVRQLHRTSGAFLSEAHAPAVVAEAFARLAREPWVGSVSVDTRTAALKDGRVVAVAVLDVAAN